MSHAPKQVAHRLLALGLSVIPVPRPRPGASTGVPRDGKTPALKWKKYQNTLPTVGEIDSWFGRLPMNLAVVTGALSGVVVIDADARDAIRWAVRHLPYTPWQTETARGCHFWYRHPGVPVGNSARLETRDGHLALDVRGDGGFVIAAGSVHASGVEYREAGDWHAPRANVPVFSPGWLERVGGPHGSVGSLSPPRRTGPHTSPDVIDRARRYLAHIPAPVIGHGSDAATLYAAARLVRGFALPGHIAVDLIWEWAGGRPGWDREWIARKVRHAEHYGSEPIGGLVAR